MVDHGIKPCYIFDGKPPELKGNVVCRAILLLHDKHMRCPMWYVWGFWYTDGQLAKRFARREEAKEGEEEAKETGQFTLVIISPCLLRSAHCLEQTY